MDKTQEEVLVYEELNALLELAVLMEGYYPWPVLLGLLNRPAFRNCFLGALPPTISWSSFWAGSSPVELNDPTSAAICLVGDDSGNLLISSNFFASSLFSTLPGVEGPLQL